MDRFQDEAAVEAPSEGAEVTRQMFGADHTVRGHEAVLDVGEPVFAQRKAGWRAAARPESVNARGRYPAARLCNETIGRRR